MVGAEAESCCCGRHQPTVNDPEQAAVAVIPCRLADHTSTALGRVREWLQPRQDQLAEEANEEEHRRVLGTASSRNIHICQSGH